MALVVQNIPQGLDTALLLIRSVAIEGDTAYPTGGYVVTPGTFGFSKVLFDINVSEKTTQNQNYILMYDRTFGTLRWFNKPATPSANLVEVATGTNLTATLMWAVTLGY